jgi:methyltransferase (TIGR00027 family)
MQDRVPSRTALTTSLIRAHHTRTDHRPLIHDPWGDTLVPSTFKTALLDWAAQDCPDLAGSPEALLDAYLARLASYASVVFRARYAEDALAEAVARGVRQYVQIGAGFDSYALRRPSSASHVEIYEVDHPATQELKLERLAQCGVGQPAHTHFIPADLAQESLAEVLKRSTFSTAEPAFFSWLGVTVYLTRDANLSSLRAIADCAAAGSRLVFTYTDAQGMKPNAESEAFTRMMRNAAAIGEPFLSGFDPGEMPRLLGGVGFVLGEDSSGTQLAERCGRSSPPLVGSRFSRIALADRAS